MRAILVLFLLLCSGAAAQPVVRGPGFVYWRDGNPQPKHTVTTPGFVFEGGGLDVDDAYRWMCARANGGDFLVIRQYGTPDYNPYIRKLCPSANSVATLKIVDTRGALQPFVSRTILQAGALFIAGGDQSAYETYWGNTPVTAALNQLARQGVPIGGTSAGNAVLAQFAFSALHNTIFSRQALADCYDKRITISDGYLNLSPLLSNFITDDHFVTRNRMGRMVTFLARIIQDGSAGQAFGIAVNEHTAFLMNSDGTGTVAGSSKVYFLRTPGPPQVCALGRPVTFRSVGVYSVARGGVFDIVQWQGTGGTAYRIGAIRGALVSSQSGGKIY